MVTDFVDNVEQKITKSNLQLVYLFATYNIELVILTLMMNFITVHPSFKYLVCSRFSSKAIFFRIMAERANQNIMLHSDNYKCRAPLSWKCFRCFFIIYIIIHFFLTALILSLLIKNKSLTNKTKAKLFKAKSTINAERVCSTLHSHSDTMHIWNASIM